MVRRSFLAARSLIERPARHLAENLMRQMQGVAGEDLQAPHYKELPGTLKKSLARAMEML